jgi:hypothetical protein
MIIGRLDESGSGSFRARRVRALLENPEACGSAYEETVKQPLWEFSQRLRADRPFCSTPWPSAATTGRVARLGIERKAAGSPRRDAVMLHPCGPVGLVPH